jgi:hypothetical protein
MIKDDAYEPSSDALGLPEHRKKAQENLTK